jgi:hypothetical protein
MPQFKAIGLVFTYMLREAGEKRGQVTVPLVPVMAAGSDVKFIMKMPRLQHGGKLLVCRQKTFLLATGKKKIRNLFWISRAHKNIRIALAAALAFPGAKD